MSDTTPGGERTDRPPIAPTDGIETDDTETDDIGREREGGIA